MNVPYQTNVQSSPEVDEPVLSIIVVSYNTREMTLACLESVYAQTTADFELIVIDNNSEDGSAEAIRAEFPDVLLVAETENHGFAPANNIAAKRARGTYILLLNPDTLVLDGALDKLLAFARKRPDARIWGGRTFFGDMTLNPASCWRQMSLWNLFCRTTGLTGMFPRSDIFNAEAYGAWDRATERQVDIVVGCLFLMRRTDWQALGGFDSTFVMYGEEADLCLRATAMLSATPYVTPEATIVHYGGASERVRADKMVRLMRAKAELIRRHIPAWQRPLAMAVFRAWPLSRSLAFGALGRLGLSKGRDSAATWQAVWSRRVEWKNGFAPNV